MTNLAAPFSETATVKAQSVSPLAAEFYPEAPWVSNQSAARTKWRSEYTNLMPQTTTHKAEIIDIFAWYWTETHHAGAEADVQAKTDQGKEYWNQDKDGLKNTWGCFGVRVSHDKDNYAFTDPEFQEFNPYSGVEYTTQDKKEWGWEVPEKKAVVPAKKADGSVDTEKTGATTVPTDAEESKYVYKVWGDPVDGAFGDPEKHRIWVTIDIDGTLEGGYMQLAIADKDGKKSARSSGKFGKVKYTEKNSDVGPGYYQLEATTKMEEVYPENDEKKNPWVVRDHLWLNGDYDAHLTGTVCRRFELEGFEKVQYMGDGWDNNYNFKFWYEVSKDPMSESDQGNAKDPPANLPAKVGSKIVAQMLIFRKAFIVDPTPRKEAAATALITSWTLLAGAYLLF